MKPFNLPITILLMLLMCTSIQAQESDELAGFMESQKAKLNLSNKTPVNAPNTDVYLVPPENFAINPSNNGFIHNNSATTIQVVEINNVNSEQIIKTLNTAYFAEQGFTLEHQETIVLDDGKVANLFVTSYQVGDEKFNRIFFFTGKQSTIWININFPSIVKSLIYQPLIASLKTVKHQSL